MTEDYQANRLSPLRQIIARRMVAAKTEAPHFRVRLGIEMDALLDWRSQQNAANPNGRISVNDCLIKACAIALTRTPEVNVQFVDDEIRQFQTADIAVVIAVEGGLATPVVRNAAAKTLTQISKEVADFANSAKVGRLKLQEITGGQISISNMGMYGIDDFDAIIGTPQCSILAVGPAKPTPIVKDGEIVIARVMRATMSIDHRALDGAHGAAFLEQFQSVLLHPAQLSAM